MNKLSQTLNRIDGKGYKAYKDIKGSYYDGDLRLDVDYVQGDPFAAPSKLRVSLPVDVCEIPDEFLSDEISRIATEDYIARAFRRQIPEVAKRFRGTGKSGSIMIDAGLQSILERTAIAITDDIVEARIEVGLPARGRKVLGRQAEEMLCDEIPELLEQAAVFNDAHIRNCRAYAQTMVNYHHIRQVLKDRELVAFVADGSILPRESGISDRPMDPGDCIPFESPEQLAIEIELPHPVGDRNTIRGMGIPKGITLIAGGGYHGKSTLLRAIEVGIYPHIPGDGREYVVTDPDAVKIRAEDRRRIEKADISPFINGLPDGSSTETFSSEEASGSTSQAAAIMEAIESGASTLLADEDTSATNLMIRDARMQKLVANEYEPITPFVDRIAGLYQSSGISSILVMGGSGDYFDVADHVIMMKDYRAYDVTADAKKIADEMPTNRQKEPAADHQSKYRRVPDSRTIDPSKGKKTAKIDAKGKETVTFGTETIDLRCVEQLVDTSQTRAAAMALWQLTKFNSQSAIPEMLDRLDEMLDQDGLESLSAFGANGEHPGNFARPRRHEIAAALNRLRSLRINPEVKE